MPRICFKNLQLLNLWWSFLFLSFCFLPSLSGFHFSEPPKSSSLTGHHQHHILLASDSEMPSKEDSPLVEAKLPLLEAHPLTDEREQDQSFPRRFWIESKRLWHIVGPSIFSRIASYSMLVITQAFAGHLGDLELAAISVANNVVVGFDFGLLVYIYYQSHLARNIDTVA